MKWKKACLIAEAALCCILAAMLAAAAIGIYREGVARRQAGDALALLCAFRLPELEIVGRGIVLGLLEHYRGKVVVVLDTGKLVGVECGGDGMLGNLVFFD